MIAMAGLPGISRSKMKVITVTSRTTATACSSLRTMKMIKLPPSGWPRRGCRPDPARHPRRGWQVARRGDLPVFLLHEIPVLGVDAEGGAQRVDPLEVVRYLVQLVVRLRLPDHGDLRRQVVLP